MGNAITAEKLKHGAPDLIVRPKVGSFRALDFLQASAILRAAEPVKAEVKEKLTALLTVGTSRVGSHRSSQGADGQRTSQRLESSSAAGLRLIQLAAAK